LDIINIISKLKSDISDYYFHREGERGKLQLNIEFSNTSTAEQMSKDKQVKEIDSIAFWE